MKGQESRLVDKILTYLRKRGGWWMKVHGGLYQVGGIPDIIGCHAGRFYTFEVKTPEAYQKPDHHLSVRQRECIKALQQSGALCECICSVEQVQAWMIWEAQATGLKVWSKHEQKKEHRKS